MKKFLLFIVISLAVSTLSAQKSIDALFEIRKTLLHPLQKKKKFENKTKIIIRQRNETIQICQMKWQLHFSLSLCSLLWVGQQQTRDWRSRMTTPTGSLFPI